MKENNEQIKLVKHAILKIKVNSVVLGNTRSDATTKHLKKLINIIKSNRLNQQATEPIDIKLEIKKIIDKFAPKKTDEKKEENENEK